MGYVFTPRNCLVRVLKFHHYRGKHFVYTFKATCLGRNIVMSGKKACHKSINGKSQHQPHLDSISSKLAMVSGSASNFRFLHINLSLSIEDLSCLETIAWRRPRSSSKASNSSSSCGLVSSSKTVKGTLEQAFF